MSCLQTVGLVYATILVLVAFYGILEIMVRTLYEILETVVRIKYTVKDVEVRVEEKFLDWEVDDSPINSVKTIFHAELVNSNGKIKYTSICRNEKDRYFLGIGQVEYVRYEAIFIVGEKVFYHPISGGYKKTE